MTIEINDVRIVRLMSGEELICDYSAGEGTHTLRLPSLIVPTGQNNIGLAPWMPYADYSDEITLDEKVVAFVVNPHEELTKEFKRIHSDAPQLIVPDKTLVGAGGVAGVIGGD